MLLPSIALAVSIGSATLSSTTSSSTPTQSISQSSSPPQSSQYAATGDFSTVVSNITAAVEKCGVRMNGQLPPFIPTGFKYSGTSRQYYLKAEEIVWNYVPDGYDDYRGISINNTKKWDGVDFVNSNTSIGSSYIKSTFRGYTDNTFTNASARPNWLGFQGPIMHGEVGDMVEVSKRFQYPFVRFSFFPRSKSPSNDF